MHHIHIPNSVKSDLFVGLKFRGRTIVDSVLNTSYGHLEPTYVFKSSEKYENTKRQRLLKMVWVDFKVFCNNGCIFNEIYMYVQTTFMRYKLASV